MSRVPGAMVVVAVVTSKGGRSDTVVVVATGIAAGVPVRVVGCRFVMVVLSEAAVVPAVIVAVMSAVVHSAFSIANVAATVSSTASSFGSTSIIVVAESV